MRRTTATTIGFCSDADAHSARDHRSHGVHVVERRALRLVAVNVEEDLHTRGEIVDCGRERISAHQFELLLHAW